MPILEKYQINNFSCHVKKINDSKLNPKKKKNNKDQSGYQ